MLDNEHATSAFKSKSGWARIPAACRYSLQGLQSAWTSEHAFRQELLLVLPGWVLALLLPVPVLEKLFLAGVLMLVLIVELLNSAIEAVVDRVSLEHHPLSKNAKDLGSAAVFLSLAFALLSWAVIVGRLFFGG